MVSSPILELPCELRLYILRHLLLIPSPIRSSFGNYELHSRILRVNKQIYEEGLKVLYGENCFHLSIRCKPGEVFTNFLESLDFIDDVDFSLPKYTLIQHYQIYVELQDPDEILDIKWAVREVATKLSDMPTIKHLRITFDCESESQRTRYPDGEDQGPYPITQKEKERHEAWINQFYDYAHVLQPFTLLRNVHQVDIGGKIRPRYSQYLKTLMEGGTLVDHLPRMFDALQHLAGPFEELERDLKDACGAMEDDKIEEFMRIRTDIARKVLERTEDAFNHLYDHDAQPATQTQSLEIRVSWKESNETTLESESESESESSSE